MPSEAVTSLPYATAATATAQELVDKAHEASLCSMATRGNIDVAVAVAVAVTGRAV
ncbi:MAG: hypothetical protein ABIP45_06260 [Knoellia sp.]